MASSASSTAGNGFSIDGVTGSSRPPWLGPPMTQAHRRALGCLESLVELVADEKTLQVREQFLVFRELVYQKSMHDAYHQGGQEPLQGPGNWTLTLSLSVVCEEDVCVLCGYSTNEKKCQSAGSCAEAYLNWLRDQHGRQDLFVHYRDVVETLQEALAALRAWTPQKHETLSMRDDLPTMITKILG